MIRSLFIADKIGNYYTISTRIVGIEITRSVIFATVVIAKGAKKTIEQCFRETIVEDETRPFVERASAALTLLFKKIGKYDIVQLALPSLGVVFKELTVPFTDLEKIKMIVPFEIESQLPFSLPDAFIDTILLDQQAQSSHVLVAAVRREQVQEYIRIFELAHLELSKVTIDVLELYGLYKEIPEYQQLTGIVMIIDIGLFITRLAIIVNGVLKTVRVLPKGVSTLVRSINGTPLEFAREDWLSDLPSKDVVQAAQDLARDFFADMQFTLQATIDKLPTAVATNKVLVAGAGADIPGIQDLVSSLFALPCEIFYAHKVIQNGTVAAKNQIGIPNSFIISVATALSPLVTNEFNLRQHYISPREERRFTIQMITIASLFLMVLTALSVHTFLTVRSLKKQIYSAEQEAITKLQKIFNLPKVNSLDRANTDARSQLDQEEKIMFSLSTHNRFCFLTYLQELSQRLDRENLGLDLKRLVLKSNESGEDVLILEGSVKNFDALRAFEEALQASQLFEEVPKLQDPKFGTLPLTFAKEKGTL